MLSITQAKVGWSNDEKGKMTQLPDILHYIVGYIFFIYKNLILKILSLQWEQKRKKWKKEKRRSKKNAFSMIQQVHAVMKHLHECFKFLRCAMKLDLYISCSTLVYYLP